MKKTTTIFIASVCLVIAVVALYSNNASKASDTDEYLSGNTECWDVYICMVKEGITDIVIGPRKGFEYPSAINIELKDSDGNVHSESTTIRSGNSYNLKYPTDKSLYKHADDLECTITYNGSSETVKLSKDS